MASNFDLATKLLAAGDIAGLHKLYQKSSDNQKRQVLQALAMGPSSHLASGPEIVELAVKGLSHKDFGVRIWACDLITNQKDKKVDVSAAIDPLLVLLNDSSMRDHAKVCFTVGHAYNRKRDMSAHFAALQKLLGNADEEVADAAAWAILKFSMGKFDIGPAVRDLAPLLANKQDSADLRKQAAKVLLHHAKKSPAALAAVRKAVKSVQLGSQKEVKKFTEQLAAL